MERFLTSSLILAVLCFCAIDAYAQFPPAPIGAPRGGAAKDQAPVDTLKELRKASKCRLLENREAGVIPEILFPKRGQRNAVMSRTGAVYYRNLDAAGRVLVSRINSKGEYSPTWLVPDNPPESLGISYGGVVYTSSRPPMDNYQEADGKEASRGIIIDKVKEGRQHRVYTALEHPFKLYPFGVTPQGGVVLIDDPAIHAAECQGPMSTVVVIGANGKVVRDYPCAGRMVRDLAVDSRGTIFLLNGAAKESRYSITRITPGGKVTRDWVKLPDGDSIASDADGTLYVSGGGSAPLMKVTRRGKLIEMPPEVWGPSHQGIAVSPSGKVAVFDSYSLRDGKVGKLYMPSGGFKSMKYLWSSKPETAFGAYNLVANDRYAVLLGSTTTNFGAKTADKDIERRTIVLRCPWR